MIEVKPFLYVRCGINQHIDITSNEPFVGSEPMYAQPTIDALQARIAELEKDAGRYRWLREEHDIDPDILIIQPAEPYSDGLLDVRLLREEADAAIDAAIKEQGNG